MSVTSYKSNEGKTFWKIYINLRSRIDPRIRVQKTEQGIESKGKAERREKELTEDCYRELVKQEGSQPTLREISYKWEEYRRACGDIQEDTIDDYLSAIKIWCDPILDKSASEINKLEVRQIITHLSSIGKSNGFQNKVLNVLKRIYSWGKDEGLIKGGLDNITLGIKINKVSEKTPEILTVEEIKKLLSLAKLRNNRWYPIWAGAIFTGMRSGELFALEWTDVDFSNGLIMASKSYNKRKNIIKSTKAGYYRTIPMNDSLKDLLLELKSTSKGNRVFPKIREWGMGLQAQELRKFCVEIGIRSVKFHALRACFATHLLSQGASLTNVMKIGGWCELATMQRYVRLAGVYEKGATDCLNHLSPITSDENVIAFKG